jgi:hypothetical protein
MKVSDKNFITIQGWMRTELNLSGNDLLVYAIIYGITQDGESEFYGSQDYMAEWCGCTTRSIRNTLDSLLTKGLLKIIDRPVGGTVHYQALRTPITEGVGKDFQGGRKIFPTGVENISDNNIDNTKEYIENNIPKGIEKNHSPIESQNNSNTLSEYEQHMYEDDVRKVRKISQGEEKESKPKKNRWQKCSDMVDEYTQNEELRTVLKDYLSDRLAMKDKPIYPNQWKGLLNRLTELSVKDDPVKIVRQSIERAYGGFFPVKEYGQYNRNSKPDPSVFGEHKGMSSKKVTKEEREERMRNGKVF